MAIAAEPRPAELPLPGGREGATVKLHPLLVARMLSPPAFIARENGRLAAAKAYGLRVPRDEYVDLPVVAFCVEHPGAGALLIDTGFHSAVVVDPAQGLGRLSGLLFKDLRMEPEDALPAQLRARGIDPASVGTVVMTHLHNDHASGVAEWPHARFVLSLQEWQAASQGSERDGYLRRQYDHAFDWRTIDFESVAGESFASFGRAVDLFGDGSVRIVFTPGHTAGHCSVVLRLADREALLTADAAYTSATLAGESLPYLMADEHHFMRSLGEIRRYAEQTPDALIVPGHDLRAFRLLDRVL